MFNNNLQPTSFRISRKNIRKIKAICEETGLSRNKLFSEMIRSYFKKLEKRRKIQENQNR